MKSSKPIRACFYKRGASAAFVRRQSRLIRRRGRLRIWRVRRSFRSVWRGRTTWHRCFRKRSKSKGLLGCHYCKYNYRWWNASEQSFRWWCWAFQKRLSVDPYYNFQTFLLELGAFLHFSVSRDPASRITRGSPWMTRATRVSTDIYYNG